MRKLLLLGGSEQQVVAIEKAKNLGLFTILCDYLPDNPGQYHADKWYSASTTDKAAILKIAKDEKIDGIIAYASDPAAPTAAYVAEQLNLATNPYKSVDILCNKDVFRDYLHNHGFDAPRAKGYSNRKDAISDIEEFKFPIIIKPVDSSGSKGATVLRGVNGLDKAIDFAFSFSHSNRIIIEEFIEKKHPYLIGGDIFVSDGLVIQWGLMNCHRDICVNPLVPVGKSYPLVLDSADIELVKKTLQRIVNELGIRFGPMNVELIVDKNGRVFPIDIGPRSGGNMIPDLLSMIFGVDIVEWCVKAAMGESIKLKEEVETPYFATLNLHTDKNGIFEDIEYDREIIPYIVRSNIYKSVGDRVSYFSNAADAIGIVFFKFPDLDTMIEMENNMNKHVKVIINEV